MTTTLVSPSDTASVHGREVPTALFIDGEWRRAETTFSVLDPATGAEIAAVSDGTADDALAALDAAAAAQSAWRHVAPRDRAELFTRAHRLLLSRADAFADVMTAESGKPNL
jgi:succinate-semialdehyde dehydrogenase/glutarate-semialdehyde dehydrogenase